MVLLTNTIIFILSLFYFRKLRSFRTPYLKQMAGFILMLGFSTLVGAVGHTVHLQLGELFFEIVLFFMNAFSLLSMYFCFRASYTYVHGNKAFSKTLSYLISFWILFVLVLSASIGDFVIIKLHALIIVIYSLTMHYLVYRRTHGKGSMLILTGLLISVLSVIVHSLRLSVDEWFNYKDIAHVIMIISLVVIFRGTLLVAKEPDQKFVTSKGAGGA
jgi:hypothetical protein